MQFHTELNVKFPICQPESYIGEICENFPKTGMTYNQPR